MPPIQPVIGLAKNIPGILERAIPKAIETAPKLVKNLDFADGLRGISKIAVA